MPNQTIIPPVNGDGARTNTMRADQAQAALESFVKARGDIFEDNSDEIADLMTDLLHHAVRQECYKILSVMTQDEFEGYIESIIRQGAMNFMAEHGNPEEM